MRAFANSFMDLSDSKTETLGQAWSGILIDATTVGNAVLTGQAGTLARVPGRTPERIPVGNEPGSPRHRAGPEGWSRLGPA